MNYFHNENCKTFVNETEQNKHSKWKTFLIHGLEELILKMSILSKEIFRFSEISIKISVTFFIALGENIYMETSNNPIWNKKNNAGGIIIPYLKI